MTGELSSAVRGRRRDRIVRVATEVFFEHGYGATTMSLISQRLGGSKATLYAYFRGKEDLFEEMIRQQCERLSRALDQAGELAGMREQLTHLGMAFMTVLVSEPGVRTLQLAIEASRNNVALAWRFEEVGVRIITGQLIAFLQQARRRGEINASDPAFAAQTFISLMRGDLHFRRLLNLIPEPSVDVVRTEVDRSVDLFLNLFASTTGSPPVTLASTGAMP